MCCTPLPAIPLAPLLRSRPYHPSNPSPLPSQLLSFLRDPPAPCPQLLDEARDKILMGTPRVITQVCAAARAAACGNAYGPGVRAVPPCALKQSMIIERATHPPTLPPNLPLTCRARRRAS